MFIDKNKYYKNSKNRYNITKGRQSKKTSFHRLPGAEDKWDCRYVYLKSPDNFLKENKNDRA